MHLTQRCHLSSLPRLPLFLASPASQRVSPRHAFTPQHAARNPQRRLRKSPCQAMLAEGSEAAIGLLSSEEDFAEAISRANVVVVDWMAKWYDFAPAAWLSDAFCWCRKCIYLKPKLIKMFNEEFPQVPLVFVDVNAVPGKLVTSNGIRKMPTIAVYKDGRKVAEHVASETGTASFQKVREIVQLALL